MIGRTLSHYRIEEKLGQGGMGIVYRARDTRLERNVAIKILPPETVADPERKHRFEREAKSASALNHPNIVTIHDIDTADGVDFIAMEYVDGEPLDRILARGRLPLEEAVDHAIEIAGALAAAHSAGIVHRDIKAANLMVTHAGHVKVLDFGLAKLVEPAVAEVPVASASPTATGVPLLTRQGVVLGTLAYMSPEQAEGRPVDARSDVFSFGAVFYEMLTGRRPFQADSNLQTLTAILRDAPPPLRSIRPDVPADLERILLRCLEKKPEARYASAAELAEDLGAFRSRRVDPGIRASSIRRRRFVVALVVALLALVAAGSWLWFRRSKTRWAREVALPEAARLVEKGRFVAAMRLAADAERYAPEEVARMRRDSWGVPISVKTEPSGADVSVKEYLGLNSEWEPIGRAPNERLRIPFGYYRWRIAKQGFQTIEVAAPSSPQILFRLDPAGSVPAGMVRVAGGSFELRSLNPVRLDDYWLDTYEVTNQQFKKFVDAGGYSKPQYWKEPFVKEGRTLSWEEAMADLRDATGRPGPSTWELGSYAEGRGDFPVNGVSWYEAAAFAEFSGKRFPTVYHWYKAAGIGIYSEILRVSNFGGQGPARVGSHPGLGPYGNFDMAGNVKEWCWNATGEKRYLLGGAWSDPNYLFWEADAQVPFDRSPTNGFRCARYSQAPPPALTGSIETLSRDYSSEKPVSDEVFRVYKSIYAYDRTPLEAKVESVDDSSPYWRKEKVSFRGASGGERVPAYLFLPRNAAPPYETVVYFPSSYARAVPSSDDLELRFVDFVIRSGRALLYPVYKDMYERRGDPSAAGPNVARDLRIQWSKEFGRSIDYLETRPDIDREKLAFYGLSLGAIDGVILVAVEPRIKAAIFLAGGFRLVKVPPEIEPINFAPRVTVPVLLAAGRQDFTFPYETAQLPMFRLLGTPEKDKRHFVYDGGHVPPRIQPIIKEILDWLDKYLGPVKTR